MRDRPASRRPRALHLQAPATAAAARPSPAQPVCLPPLHTCCCPAAGPALPPTDEVNAIVLDIGTYAVKAGYAGEDTPKYVFPSVRRLPRFMLPRRVRPAAPY